MPDYNPVLVNKLERILADMKAGRTIQVMDNGKWVDLDPCTTTINLSWNLRPEPYYRWFTLEELAALMPKIRSVRYEGRYDDYTHFSLVYSERLTVSLEFGEYTIDEFNKRVVYTNIDGNEDYLGVLVEGTYDQD